MEYQLVVANETDALCVEVSRLVGMGWACQGGIAVVHDSGRDRETATYYQAMVRLT